MAAEGDVLISLSGNEIGVMMSAVMKTNDPKVILCRLRANNSQVWLSLANYLVNVKYGYGLVKDLGMPGNNNDWTIRDKIAGLNDDQRLELIKLIKDKLTTANNSKNGLYDNLAEAFQKDYREICSSDASLLSRPHYPTVPLRGVTKNVLLALIETAKTNVPAKPVEPACSEKTVTDCLGKIDAARRREILTPFYPFSQICEFTPKAGRQDDQALVVTFTGSITGVLKNDNVSLADNFAVDFGGDGVNATCGTPTVMEGVVTTLPVNVKIDNDKNTKLGAREIKIKLGVTTLQTLTGFEVKPKAVTAKRVPATGQPATQQPAKVPAGNPFEL